MKMYLEHHKHQKQKAHGKISVKELVGQGMGASSIEVTDNNIKYFERVAKKYNVDFSVKKDKAISPPKYIVFFKGKDADVITQALRGFEVVPRWDLPLYGSHSRTVYLRCGRYRNHYVYRKIGSSRKL